jgi:hypothetical protein
MNQLGSRGCVSLSLAWHKADVFSLVNVFNLATRRIDSVVLAW